MERPRVLFVDQTNAARSRIAEALLRHYGEGRYEVFSAGTAPDGLTNDAAIILREQGVPIPDEHQVAVDELADLTFDYVITVCDESEPDCPDDIEMPGAPEKMRWRFSDPANAIGDRLNALRRLRDEILSRIRYFILTDRSDT